MIKWQSFRKPKRQKVEKSKKLYEGIEVHKYYPVPFFPMGGYRWVPEIRLEEFEGKGYRMFLHPTQGKRCYYIPFNDFRNMKEYLMYRTSALF